MMKALGVGFIRFRGWGEGFKVCFQGLRGLPGMGETDRDGLMKGSRVKGLGFKGLGFRGFAFRA